MMVAGTATSVAVALVNDRRLTPVLAGVTPSDKPIAPVTSEKRAALPGPREFIARRFASASLIGLLAIALVAAVPAVTALAANVRAPSEAPAMYGPPLSLRAAAGVAGNWERSYSTASPSGGELGAAVMAGAEEQYRWNVLQAMVGMAEEQAASQAAAQRGAVAGAASYSMNGASGYAAGTVLRARITIYGCTGPGGGFCNNMASGVPPFEGAAACSTNLPFGTRLTIVGDPTGRVYECLDRGALASTWVDVFFYNTSDGMAWQSALGGTVADVVIVN